jgi:hypothetical protein
MVFENIQPGPHRWRWGQIHSYLIYKIIISKNKNKQDFKEAYDSVRKEVFYNILIQIGVSMKVVWLIKMCLNETRSEVRIGKHLSDTFPIQNGLKQGNALSTLLFDFALEYAIRKV